MKLRRHSLVSRLCQEKDTLQPWVLWTDCGAGRCCTAGPSALSSVVVLRACLSACTVVTFFSSLPFTYSAVQCTPGLFVLWTGQVSWSSNFCINAETFCSPCCMSMLLHGGSTVQNTGCHIRDSSVLWCWHDCWLTSQH